MSIPRFNANKQEFYCPSSASSLKLLSTGYCLQQINNCCYTSLWYLLKLKYFVSLCYGIETIFEHILHYCMFLAYFQLSLVFNFAGEFFLASSGFECCFREFLPCIYCDQLFFLLFLPSVQVDFIFFFFWNKSVVSLTRKWTPDKMF